MDLAGQKAKGTAAQVYLAQLGGCAVGMSESWIWMEEDELWLAREDSFGCKNSRQSTCFGRDGVPPKPETNFRFQFPNQSPLPCAPTPPKSKPFGARASPSVSQDRAFYLFATLMEATPPVASLICAKTYLPRNTVTVLFCCHFC
jgi:hypothetical protein